MQRLLPTLTIAVVVAATGIAAGGKSSTESRLVVDAAESLLEDHVEVRPGQWAWKSRMQRRHLQTDRDVGAAGILVALLAAYEATDDQRYLEAARHAGDWLLEVARKQGGLYSWPDYADRSGVSDSYFTSFDDGTPGIADALWRLGTETGDEGGKYVDAAVAGMRWLLSQAEDVEEYSCPSQRCRWPYYEDADDDYRTGMAEGVAGIVYALDLFAERFPTSDFQEYASAGATYLESLLSRKGAIPEVPGGDEYNTGYYHGSAGASLVFLRLYHHTGDTRWLKDAERLLAWVRARAIRQQDGAAWPISVDGENRPVDSRLGFGMEEGAAGIGWIALQAFKLTDSGTHLTMAEQAADFVFGNTIDEFGGNTWPENKGQKLVHVGLVNGAAGIAWFMHDLSLVNHNHDYEDAAVDALTWLSAVAQHDARGVWWYEHRKRGRWKIPREPSWHWGTAGILGLAARLDGGTLDMPSNQEGF